MRAICYFLVVTQDNKHLRQWILSVRSLRTWNRSLPVFLFVFDELPDVLTREAKLQGVEVLYLGSFVEWMRSRPHRCAAVVANYIPAGQLLTLIEARRMCKVSHAFYVDCDTFFFRDPEYLFEDYGGHDWSGRIIPGSRLSPEGESANLDEDRIAQIMAQEGLRRTLPLNNGAGIFSARVLDVMGELEAVFFDFAWRLMIGLQRPSVETKNAPEGRGDVRALTAAAVEQLRPRVLQVASQTDLKQALPYPSDNWWILPEIAWHLAIGRSVAVSQQAISSNDVAQGMECIEAVKTLRFPAVAHYFSHNEKQFIEELQRARTRALEYRRRGFYS